MRRLELRRLVLWSLSAIILLIRIDLLLVIRSLSWCECIVELLITLTTSYWWCRGIHRILLSICRILCITTHWRCRGIHWILRNLLVHSWILNLNLNLLWFSFLLFGLFLINNHSIGWFLNVSSSSFQTTTNNTYATTNNWYPHFSWIWHFTI